MSTGGVKKVSPQDLQLVQNLIERCLQLYMSQKEVVSTLLHQAKIEPSFTELVWQKLEEENQDFFKAYHLRLILKDQIMTFNKLLKTQAEMMHHTSPTAGAVSVSVSNESHVPLLNQNSSCYAPENTGKAMKPEKVLQPTANNLPNTLTNGVSSLPQCMQPAVGMSSFSRTDDVSSNLLLAQNSNMGLVEGISSQGMIKSESGYSGGPSFMYNTASNAVERQPSMAEVPVPSFIDEESNTKPLNEPIVEPDTSSFGFLSQIPRNFSLSDLTADFSISSDILDSYSGSLYLATDTDLLKPHGNGDIQGDGKRLETISEGLSYEGFASD